MIPFNNLNLRKGAVIRQQDKMSPCGQFAKQLAMKFFVVFLLLSGRKTFPSLKTFAWNFISQNNQLIVVTFVPYPAPFDKLLSFLEYIC